jgi:Cytochrome P460
MDSTLNYLAAIAACTLLATSAPAQSAKDIRSPSPLVAITDNKGSPIFGVTILAGKGAFVPGQATTLQIMVKDSKKYASTGGWGFGRFIDGKPVDEAQHKTCFARHEAT